MIVDHRDLPGTFKRLSIPLAVAMLGDIVLGVVDTIAIGALGTTSLAGATAATSAFGVILSAVAGSLGGMSIIAAQRIGAGDMEGFGSVTRGAIAYSFVLAVAASVASLALAHPIMHLMLGSLPTAGAAAWYFICRCFALMAIVVTSSISAALGAAGYRKFAIRTLIVMNIIHIPLLLILGLGWFTHHAWGIIGAGVATSISDFAAAGYAIIFLLRHPEYQILSRFTVDWKLAWRCAKLGLPEAAFLVLLVLPDSIIIGLLSPLGSVTISALRALNVVNGLTYIIPGPLQSATQTVIGQRLGARDGHGAFWFFNKARRVTAAFATASGVVVGVFAWPLSYFFTLNAAVANVAAGPLALLMLTLPVRTWAQVSLAPIRASGDTVFSMFVGIWCCSLIPPVAWLGITYWHLGLYGVPIAYMVGWGARAIVTDFKLRRSDWRSREPIMV